MSGKCFKKCITKPGYSLDSSEQVRPFFTTLTEPLVFPYIPMLIYFIFRNVLQCVWTAIWILGIWFPKHIATACRKKV